MLRATFTTPRVFEGALARPQKWRHMRPRATPGLAHCGRTHMHTHYTRHRKHIAHTLGDVLPPGFGAGIASVPASRADSTCEVLCPPPATPEHARTSTPFAPRGHMNDTGTDGTCPACMPRSIAECFGRELPCHVHLRGMQLLAGAFWATFSPFSHGTSHSQPPHTNPHHPGGHHGRGGHRWCCCACIGRFVGPGGSPGGVTRRA